MTRTLFRQLCSALPVIAAISHAGDDPLVVDLGYAKYRSSRSSATGVTAWYGLRYAASPAGENRWRPPQPIANSSSYDPNVIYDATQPAGACVQGLPAWSTSLQKGFGGQEDCLTVDILTPNNPTADGLPVWVEIHGGGYTSGSAAIATGYALVNASQGNLIFVQVQYQLGAFGFLASDEVQADGTANAGLLDQRLALEWVQNHIAKFGGDPHKVTIHGGSAGGGSVTAQLTMYGGTTPAPFRAAIAEYPWWQPFHNKSVTEGQYIDLLYNTDCCDLQCLRQVPEGALADAAQKTYIDGYKIRAYGYGDFYYGPVVDGEIISDLPSELFAAGNFTSVPLLVNHDLLEGASFTNQSLTTEDEVRSGLEVLWPGANSSLFVQIDQLYPPADFSSASTRMSTIFGDAFVNCVTTQLAQAFSRRQIPVWKQVFNTGTRLHAATAPFLFGTRSDGSTVPADELNSKLMKDWFLSFVVDLDPNSRSFSDVAKPHWPEYNLHREVLQVNDSSSTISSDPDSGARCAFFQEVGGSILN